MALTLTSLYARQFENVKMLNFVKFEKLGDGEINIYIVERNITGM